MNAVRLGVLGDPLTHTLSPELHRAGGAALGMPIESVAIRTPPSALAETLDRLEREGFRGVNVTHPLKADVLKEVSRVTDLARRARSANTIGFEDGGRWADTTDGAGFLDLLAEGGRSPAGLGTLLLGAGGSARSLAVALIEAGGSVTVSARDPEKRARAWSDVPARFVGWRSAEEREALSLARLVVNCTPLTSEHNIAPLSELSRQALLVDLVYGERVTRWVVAARAEGFDAWDGLGLVVHQARRSLELWFRHEVPIEALARAVGWPR